jgi:hypothetical protein
MTSKCCYLGDNLNDILSFGREAAAPALQTPEVTFDKIGVHLPHSEKAIT